MASIYTVPASPCLSTHRSTGTLSSYQTALINEWAPVLGCRPSKGYVAKVYVKLAEKMVNKHDGNQSFVVDEITRLAALLKEVRAAV